MSENFKSNLEEENIERKTKTQIISEYSDEALNDLFKIEKASFPEDIQSSKDDLKEVLEDPDGIHIFAKDEDGKTIGAVLTLPQSTEYKFLKDHDPKFNDDKDSLYVESAAIIPGERGLSTAMALLKSLIEQAKSKGFKKITMHARVNNGLSEVLQRRYNANFLRRLENWHDFGEPFDYLEIDLPEDNE